MLVLTVLLEWTLAMKHAVSDPKHCPVYQSLPSPFADFWIVVAIQEMKEKHGLELQNSHKSQRHRPLYVTFTILPHDLYYMNEN